MKFKKLVCIDETKMNEASVKRLHDFADEVEVFSDYPEDQQTIIDRAKKAEAILVSWHTEISAEVIDAAPNLRYIGMACSLYDDESANVAVDHARSKGITVTGIFDYGDPGVGEFIISELIQLLNGYKGKTWKNEPVELNSLKIGIIGLGVTGQLLADYLQPFQPSIYYFSRTRKADYEQKGVKFLELEELLKTCDVISIHLPKHTELLNYSQFEQLGRAKILINTSLGRPFALDAFENWLQTEGNFAIFDGDAMASLPEKFSGYDQVISNKVSAGWSLQTKNRLSEKVIENIQEYIQQENTEG
ncbi:MAG: NAD(P)-dependent oxidoreductase [Christiangramia sp.]|uniref:NAD(P)-dependent oxidoreductase n=1 Tax=Christiangramia sp. TaxID=1931228 RepID=UPI003242B341